MNKTFLKKSLLICLSVTPIVALIITFCNHLYKPFLNQYVYEQDCTPAELLGDRGGAHMPDIGFSLPQDNWFVILIACLAVISLVCVITLIVLKIKLNAKQKIEKQKLAEEEQNNVPKKSTSLKEIVARNLENDSKEYEKIDNPKH